MSVYKRPGAETYYFDFRFRNHRFHGPTFCKTKRDAERLEDQERKRAQAAEIDMSKPMSFGAASSLWWDQVGQHLANSADQERYLAWLQRNIGLATKLTAITDIKLSVMVSNRRRDGVSNATVNRSVTVPLRQIINRAKLVWKVAVPDIAWKQHMLEEAAGVVRVVSRESEDLLVEKTRDDYAVPLRFAYMSGCRRMEIVGLQWPSVNFFSREFTVTGKRGRVRTIPMTQEIYDLLWSQKDFHPTAVFTYAAVRTRVDAETGRKLVRGQRYPITMNGFKTEWRRMKMREGVSGVRFHDSRHTAATRVLRASGDMKAVQKMLGHADIATTSIYADADIEQVRLAMETVTASRNATENTTDRGKILDFKGK
jgi:site-specific recombinase XerC